MTKRRGVFREISDFTDRENRVFDNEGILLYTETKFRVQSVSVCKLSGGRMASFRQGMRPAMPGVVASITCPRITLVYTA